MKDAINRVGDQMGLPNGWLNTDFMKTTSYTPKLIQYSQYYKTFSNPVVVRSWTPEDVDAIYIIEILKRKTYCLNQMETWLRKLAFYEANYRKIVKRSDVGKLQLLLEEPCSDEQKELYKKDFQDIIEKLYKGQNFELEIIEKDLLENSDELKMNEVFISSVSVLPVEKEMVYAMDIGIVAKVLASRPVLVGTYDSIQEVNRQIDQYYQAVWKEWEQRIDDHKEDADILERIASQPEKT